MSSSPTNPCWRDLGARHSALLDQHGREHFKRTVNQHYFNWSVLGILRFQFGAVLRAWLRRPDWAVFASRLEAEAPASADLFHPRGAAALIYRLYVAMLASAVGRQDPQHLVGGLQEPIVGDPIAVRYRGVRLSQDLCNSIHEYYRIAAHLPSQGPATVLEIGAGYGRLAYVTLSARPDTRYIIVDIPPARDLAAWYLATCLPSLKVFACREDATDAQLCDALETHSVIFVAPHQVSALPSKIVDAACSISSLHEMALAEIGEYFKTIDRLSRGVFYTKQWRVATVPANETVIREFEYPVPTTWERLYHRRHPFLPRFFEACYRVK